MFNLNELFIPANYDLTKWTDVDNIVYKNKAYFSFENKVLESGFYGQYYDFTEKTRTTKEPMNSNCSIIVDRINLYLLSFNVNDLDVLLDGELKDWTILVEDEKMLITFRNDFADQFKSFQEKIYILNLKEYEETGTKYKGELTKYKELIYVLEHFKNKYGVTRILTYKDFIDTLEKRLLVEETDKEEANAIIDTFKDAYNDNHGLADDEWKKMLCCIDEFTTPMREIIEDNKYVIPFDDVEEVIDYSLLNDKLKYICLKEQNKF